MSPAAAKTLETIAVFLGFCGALFMGAQQTEGAIESLARRLEMWNSWGHERPKRGRERSIYNKVRRRVRSLLLLACFLTLVYIVQPRLRFACKVGAAIFAYLLIIAAAMAMGSVLGMLAHGGQRPGRFARSLAFGLLLLSLPGILVGRAASSMASAAGQWSALAVRASLRMLRAVFASVEGLGRMFGYRTALQRFGVILLVVASFLWLYVYLG